jgi:hypothetical protein
MPVTLLPAVTLWMPSLLSLAFAGREDLQIFALMSWARLWRTLACMDVFVLVSEKRAPKTDLQCFVVRVFRSIEPKNILLLCKLFH